MKRETQDFDPRLHRLVEGALPGARVISVTPLGVDVRPDGGSTKGAGYGAPLRLDLDFGGERRTVVLHTATANAFGHDRRADRAAEAILAADTFDTVPRHVKVLDVGAYRLDGGHISLRDTGEFYVLSEWAEGEIFAERLRRIAREGVLHEDDVATVERLASYLVDLHTELPAQKIAQSRAHRDLLGSGEGIFGIIDSYPAGSPEASPARLRRIEELCHAWRWRLKELPRPVVRTHGDFHPFNVLLDRDGEPRVLDTSRGSVGDAADDVTCMALNFPFFALERPGVWDQALSVLWYAFIRRYLEGSKDIGVLDVAAPFFAWRGLVLASPVWYPDLSSESRRKLLEFVEATLKDTRFRPESIEELFR
jgi:hypothetical protein